MNRQCNEAFGGWKKAGEYQEQSSLGQDIPLKRLTTFTGTQASSRNTFSIRVLS